MTSPNASESESQQIDAIEKQIEVFRSEKAAALSAVKKLLLTEDIESGVFHHEEIFRLKQDSLRLDTEVQFLQVKLRRLKSTW